MIIKVVVMDFQGEDVVLKTEDGQKIIWPKNKLPEKLSLNETLKIAISKDNETESADKELAKDILNEILNTGQEG